MKTKEMARECDLYFVTKDKSLNEVNLCTRKILRKHKQKCTKFQRNTYQEFPGKITFNENKDKLHIPCIVLIYTSQNTV